MRIATDTAISLNIGSSAQELLREISSIMRPLRRILVLIGKVRVRSLVVAPFHQSDPLCAVACPAPFSGAHVAFAIAAKVTHDKPRNF